MTWGDRPPGVGPGDPRFRLLSHGTRKATPFADLLNQKVDPKDRPIRIGDERQLAENALGHDLVIQNWPLWFMALAVKRKWPETDCRSIFSSVIRIWGPGSGVRVTIPE